MRTRAGRRTLLAAGAALVAAASLAVTSTGGAAPAAPTPVDDDSIDLDDLPAEAAPLEVPVDEVPELVDAADEPLDLRGDEAVAALDDAGLTDEVAADVGLEPDELVEELVEDESLFVTPTGQLGYVEYLEPDLDALSLPDGEVGALAGQFEALGVFDLASRPGSPRTIYLDFTGHSTTGVFTTLTGQNPTVSAPYDTDGQPQVFTADEQQDVYEVWLQVAEDYAPFDVNVTTKDPGAAALVRTSAGDRFFGQRVVITPDNFLGPNFLGIALVGSFDDAVDTPAFVFSDEYGGVPKVIAEAVSHETGHTVGLLHDGIGLPVNGDFGYYGGHGSWAPIMGNGVNRAVTQWSKGEYAGANNQEDDIARIAACVGAAPDDWPNAGDGGGLGLSGTSTQYGEIGGFGDVDVIPLNVGAGVVTVSFAGAAPYPNLRAQVRVLDGSGDVVAQGSSAGLVGGFTFATPFVPAGRYAVEVRSAGSGTASTGFTTYGSIGRYRVEVIAAAPASPPVAGSPNAYASAVRSSLAPSC